MNNKEIGQRIKERRTELGLKQEDIAKKIGVATSTVQRYEAGTIDKPKLPVLEAIARAIKVAPDWLIGKNDEMIDDSFDNLPDNIIPLPKMKKIPLVGEIACGVPILADENIEEYLACPDGIHADFCLKCKGDSMIGSRIYNGDIVYIRKQEIVENGEIAAVLIDGEATLKKVYITPSKVTLRASNPLYDDIVVDNRNDVHILGLAVAFFSSLQKPQATTLKPQESEIEVFAARDGDTSELNEEGKKAAKELFDNWDNLK